MCPKSFTIEDDLSRENLRSKFAIEDLSILNDIANAIAYTHPLNQITNLIVKKCVKHLKSEQGPIQLIDEKSVANPFHTMIRLKDSLLNIDALRVDRQIGMIPSNKKPILINELHHEEKVSLTQNSVLKIRNMLFQ